MLTTLAVQNYRSLRDLKVGLGRVTVVTGENGTGKSSLYRVLRMLAQSARGGLIRSLAHEGGFDQTFWAGPESVSAAMRRGEVEVQGTVRKGPRRLRIGFQSEDFGYAMALGNVQKESHRFATDAEVKSEHIWAGERLAAMLVKRRRNVVVLDGAVHATTADVPVTESLLTHLCDPENAPEVLFLRERLRSWRFYDHLRTDPSAPARTPCVTTWTPVMAGDGNDLAAALATIQRTPNIQALDRAISDAFPGCSVSASGASHVSISWHQHGLLRPLTAPELSEGTMRYLMLNVALCSPSPPELLILNEPEASLHGDLLPALGRAINEAAERTQIVVVTHSLALAETLSAHPESVHIGLSKELGETHVEGRTLLNEPPWEWPARR